MPNRLLELPNLRLWQAKWFLFCCKTSGCGKPRLSFSTGPKSALIPAQHGPAFSFRVIFVPSSMGNHHKNGGRRHPGASPFYMSIYLCIILYLCRCLQLSGQQHCNTAPNKYQSGSDQTRCIVRQGGLVASVEDITNAWGTMPNCQIILADSVHLKEVYKHVG